MNVTASSDLLTASHSISALQMRCGEWRGRGREGGKVRKGKRKRKKEEEKSHDNISVDLPRPWREGIIRYSGSNGGGCERERIVMIASLSERLVGHGVWIFIPLCIPSGTFFIDPFIVTIVATPWGPSCPAFASGSL